MSYIFLQFLDLFTIEGDGSLKYFSSVESIIDLDIDTLDLLVDFVEIFTDLPLDNTHSLQFLLGAGDIGIKIWMNDWTVLEQTPKLI